MMKSVRSFLFENRIVLALASMFAGITVLLYIPTLWYGFIFDDFPTIVEYQHIKVFDPLNHLFSNSRWISRIIHKFVYSVWGMSPMAFRVVNLVMQLAIVLMIFFLVVAICKRFKQNSLLHKQAYLFSSLVTGLFILHPVQTQTAAYITQMSIEGIVVFFIFAVLTSYFFATATKNQRARIALYLLSGALIFTSTGTKEIVIILPALLILFDWFLVAQGSWASFKKRIPVLALLCAVFCVSLYKVGVLKPRFVTQTLVPKAVPNNRGNILTKERAEAITPSNYFISQFKILTHYVMMFFWPFNISFDYDVRLSDGFWSLDVIFPLLFLLLLFFLCLWMFIRNPGSLVVFSLGWFFIATFPRASFFPCTELVCDYKTYIGSFGMMFLLAYLFVLAIKFCSDNIAVFTDQKYHIAAVGVFLLILGFASNARNKVWSSELLFWQDCIQNAPSKSRGWNNVAVAFWDKGDVTSAIQHFQKAIELDQNYGEPHVNLGTIFHMQGDKDKAFYHYKKAVETGEGHPQLYFNLGMLHISNGNDFSAEHCFNEAIQLRPYYGKAYAQLGSLYQAQGKFDKALQIYQTGLHYEPGDAQLHYMCATLSHDTGNYDQAIALLERLDKNFMDVPFYLGSCYYNKRDYARAAQYFGSVYSRDQNNLIYIYNYAQSLLNTNQFDQAIPLYEKIKDRHDIYAYAPLHLARCFYEIGENKEALQTLKETLKSSPHDHIKKDAVSMIKQINKQGKKA
ncbi:MAG: tetratricopeptide repeat protein [bacterium]